MGWLIAILGGPEGAALMLLKRCWGWIGKAWSWVAASTTHLLIVACAILAFWGFAQHHEAAKWHKAADHCANAHRADAAAATTQETTSTKIAETIDAKHTAALVVDHTAIDRYADTHRVQPTRPAVDRSQGDLSPVSENPAAMPFDVTLSRGDLDACAADFRYAWDAHENAVKQVEVGAGKWAD